MTTKIGMMTFKNIPTVMQINNIKSFYNSMTRCFMGYPISECYDIISLTVLKIITS